MELSVIIPTLNEENYIESCLKSISNQNFPREKYEIIVSDACSTDKTVEIARKYADRVVMTKKRGIWYGRNLGAKSAKGKYLVFIDADTAIDEDYLETVHKYLEDGIAGITTGFQLSNASITTKIIENLAYSYLVLVSTIWNHSLNGINLCVPRDLFIKIGGFKDCALEDGQINKDLRKHGRIIFLKDKKAKTSTRRLDEFGPIGICRYYFELGMIDKGFIKTAYGSKLIKYASYIPIRNNNPGKRSRGSK